MLLTNQTEWNYVQLKLYWKERAILNITYIIYTLPWQENFSVDHKAQLSRVYSLFSFCVSWRYCRHQQAPTTPASNILLNQLQSACLSQDKCSDNHNVKQFSSMTHIHTQTQWGGVIWSYLVNKSESMHTSVTDEGDNRSWGGVSVKSKILMISLSGTHTYSI